MKWLIWALLRIAKPLAAILKKMKIQVYLMFVLILSSCNPSYKVDEDKIKGSRKFEHGFQMSEIKVRKFNDEGRPTKYDNIISVVCAPVNTFSFHLSNNIYSQSEKEIIKKNNGIMDSIMDLNGNVLGGDGHNQGLDEYIKSEQTIKKIENKYFDFNPKKTIYFNKSNQNYKWIYLGETNFFDYDRGVHNKLPLVIKPGKWYLLDFSNSSQLTDKLFFKIINNGLIIKHHHYYQPLFGV